MTRHWVGWVCAEVGWNWLWFGSKYYSNTWFYMSVCLCFATCVTLVTGLFIFVVCPCRLLLRQAGREKKQNETERHVKRWGVQCGALRQTNRPRLRHLGWQNITHIHTGNWTLFVAEMVWNRAECLKENHTGSKQSVTRVSLLWNVK